MSVSISQALRRWMVALTLLAAPLLYAQQKSEEEATGFVASIAKTVYAAAYPTATYKDWKIRSVNRAGSGLDLVVRFMGVGFFNDDVYVDLAFKFRDGGLSDVSVAGDNALFMPPFGTTALAGKAIADLIDESQQPSPAPPPVVIPKASPAAVHSLRVVSTCAYPISLWIRVADARNGAHTYGAYSINAKERTLLNGSEGARLQLYGSAANYYGEIPNYDAAWGGDISVPYGNATLKMRSVDLPLAPDGAYELAMSCDNISAKDANKTGAPTLFLGASVASAEDFEAPARTGKGGAQLVAVMTGMPAETAGMKAGDIVFQFDQYAVTDVASLQAAVKAVGRRETMVHAWRQGGERTFRLTPSPKPVRQRVDAAKCSEAGNPADYYLGAIGTPFAGSSGNYVVPLFPGTQGRLFDPLEVDIYVDLKDAGTAYIFYGKPLRGDIAKFEYYDWDHALLAVTTSGERIDLGVRVQCLIQPGMAMATEVRLSRTQNQKEVSFQVLPLDRVN